MLCLTKNHGQAYLLAHSSTRRGKRSPKPTRPVTGRVELSDIVAGNCAFPAVIAKEAPWHEIENFIFNMKSVGPNTD